MGDSAALFIDPVTGRATELTEDHRLTNPRERQRLQDMGIQVGCPACQLAALWWPRLGSTPCGCLLLAGAWTLVAVLACS